MEPIQISINENNQNQCWRKKKNYNQYFTPEFIAEKALSFISRTNIKNVIDPAVGNGVFIKVAANRWKNAKLYGIDIDKDVIEELNKFEIPNSDFLCGDSILHETWQFPEVQKVIAKGGFELVVGNPPYSSWMHRIELKEILINYEMGKNYKTLRKSQAIEILFIEIFVKLCREEGFIVIVLPDGILSVPQYNYVREFILKNTEVLKVINLPRNIFENTSAKTSILVLQKSKKSLNYKVQISDIDKNGIINHTIKVSANNLINRMDYCYYQKFKNSYIQQLLKNKYLVKNLKNYVIYCKRGKTIYGKERSFSKNGLRFLHSTNITETGINYNKEKKIITPNSKMDIKSAYAELDDILIVRVGDACIGRTAIIATKKDIGVVSDCIFRIRVKDISPYYLTVYLKTKFAKEWIDLQKHGSATTCINKLDILSIPVPILTKQLQHRISKNYIKILKSKNNITCILKKLTQIIRYLEINIENLLQ